MADDVRCPSCGAAIPPGATAGLCPRCLLRQALHDDESLLAEETTIQSAGSRSQDDHPSTIGPYKILDRLGEGGMGVVYLAEQQQPVQRRVALKVIKRGMDTREVVARFETERQALALMNHPSIAKVFDAGETADGRPYFVMEHVPGEPITEYCDRHRLPNVARLTLLRLVCDAIQHAHQKGVIHRDLKPTNVLVTLQDGRPLPKVIDFGVAKATHQRLTEKSLFTQVGVLIGTPEYMSPEQADLTGLDVDTRTDVYGLGVLLYELLVGVLPFDGQTLRRQAFDEIRRIIREEDPARPSTRVSRSDATTDVLAKRRNTDVGTLRRELRGDLDWITLKALEKDRSRRYGSAAELAADLERHLAHEPVLASPPSTAYHVGKFVRRHRVGVAASAAVVILLVVFGATTAVQAARIAQERDRANQEADTAREVTDFLVGMFELADPSVARGETITALEILARGTERIKSELAGSPELQATLHDAVGRVYGGLQLYDTAEPLLETALETRRRVFGNNSLEVAGTLHNLGRLRLGDHQYADAIAPLREAADIQREVSGQESLDLAANLSGLGHALDYMARSQEDLNLSLRGSPIDRSASREEAERVLREALAIQRQQLGNTNATVAETLVHLGWVLGKRGDTVEAEALLDEAADIGRAVLDETDPLRGFILAGSAVHYLQDVNVIATGVAPLRELIAIEERLDRRSAGYLEFVDALALHLARLGQFDEALGLVDLIPPCREACLHSSQLEWLRYRRIGQLRWSSGDLQQVETPLRAAVEASTHLEGVRRARFLHSLAVFLQERGDLAESEALLRDEVTLLRESLASTHRSLLPGRPFTLPANDADLANVLTHLGEVLQAQGDQTAALGLFDEAFSLVAPLVDEVRPQVDGRRIVNDFRHKEVLRLGYYEGTMGRALKGLGRYGDAEPLLVAAHEKLAAYLSDRDYQVRILARRIVDLYERLGRADDASEYRMDTPPGA